MIIRRKLISIIVFILCSISAEAYDFKAEGYYFSIIEGANEVYIYPGHAARQKSYSGDITIPETVNDNGVVYTVVGIGSYAFSNSSITSISMPNTIRFIDDCAFLSCSSLTSLELPNKLESIGEYIISNTAITHIKIPNSVTKIANYAFAAYSFGLSPCRLESIDLSELSSSITELPECMFSSSNLKSIEIPNTITSIGKSVFSGCRDLVSVTIPNSVKSIGKEAFNGSAWLDNQPDGVIYAGKVAYMYKGTMPNNTSITLKEGTVSITDYAFSSLSGLTFVSIPNSLILIGDYAFMGCRNLSSVTISHGVTKIGDYAFAYCSGLISITIPNSVTSIGNSAFWGSNGLSSVKVEWKSPIDIVSNTFSNSSNATLYVPKGSKSAYQSANYWKDFKEIVEYQVDKNINFADAIVKAICVANWDTNGDGELSEQEAAAVTDIGTVFKEKATIKTFVEFKFFTGIKAIPSYAFSHCNNLTSITIPNSVTRIGIGAFSACI